MIKNYNVNGIENGILNITGTGNHSVWQQAELLTDFVSPWCTKKVEKIEFRALWDAENLFFCFTVYDAVLHIDKNTNGIESIGKSDRVELFFRTNESLNPYYCLEIDPSPRIMDFKAQFDKQFDFNWEWPKNDIIVKSEITNTKFTVEIAITLASLKKLHLIKNNKIETGIFRAKYSPDQHLAMAPSWITWVNPETKNPNFHTPSSFGVLTLLNR